MTIDEQLAALPEPIKVALRDLVRVLGGLSQEEKAGLMKALHKARKGREDNWTGGVFEALNHVASSVFVAAMPSPEKVAGWMRELRENEHG